MRRTGRCVFVGVVCLALAAAACDEKKDQRGDVLVEESDGIDDAWEEDIDWEIIPDALWEFPDPGPAPDISEPDVPEPDVPYPDTPDLPEAFDETFDEAYEPDTFDPTGYPAYCDEPIPCDGVQPLYTLDSAGGVTWVYLDDYNGCMALVSETGDAERLATILRKGILDPDGATTFHADETPAGEPCNDRAYNGTISDNGTCGAFSTTCTDLLPDEPPPAASEVVVFKVDLETGEPTATRRFDATDEFTASAEISGDGKTIMAQQNGMGGPWYFLDLVADGAPYDSWTLTSDVQADEPRMSYSGRYVAFETGSPSVLPNDTNGQTDVFVLDRGPKVAGAFDPSAESVIRVSVGADGTQGDGLSFSAAISHDGRFVAFVSEATNLTPVPPAGWARHVYVHDRDTDDDGVFDEVGAVLTTRVSVSSAGALPDDMCSDVSISGDGRYVVFSSYATNLVPGVSGGQVYVHDRQTGQTELVSQNDAGEQCTPSCSHPIISPWGESVAFESGTGSNLGPNADTTVWVAPNPLYVP